MAVAQCLHAGQVPCPVVGVSDRKDMREGHKHLLEKGLNDSHVDVVIEHLGATLKELGVSDEQIQQVADLANSVRDDVLSR